MDMEVESKKQNVEEQTGPNEKQIESLLISFLNSLVQEQNRPTPATPSASLDQESSR